MINKTILTYFCILSINDVYAANESSVEFFASNNIKEINPQTAYIRLTGVRTIGSSK